MEVSEDRPGSAPAEPRKQESEEARSQASAHPGRGERAGAAGTQCRAGKGDYKYPGSGPGSGEQ